MLGQKATAYLEEKEMVDAVRGKLEAEIDELEETKEKLEESYRRAEALEAEKSLLEREREAIGTTDLEEADEKLRQCRKRQEDAKKEITRYSQNMERHRNAIREYDAAIREIRKKIDLCQMETEQLVSDMNELQETIRFSGHEQILSLWKDLDSYGTYKNIKNEIEKLCKNVEAALEEMKRFREIIITNLFDTYDRLMEFGKKHLSDPFILEGINSVSARDKILREIFSNLLAHRDYSSAYVAKFVIEKQCMYTENANRAHGHGMLE